MEFIVCSPYYRVYYNIVLFLKAPIVYTITKIYKSSRTSEYSNIIVVENNPDQNKNE